jgi:hypothetical protein
MAMRFRDLNDDIIADLGGRDRLSTGQLQLVRRAATLSVTAEGKGDEGLAVAIQKREITFPDGPIRMEFGPERLSSIAMPWPDGATPGG